MKKNGIFNSATFFDKYLNTKILSKFNGVYSRNDLPKERKDGGYVINVDDFADVVTHWICLGFFVKEMKLFILIVLVLNTFLKKFKNL